MTHERSKPSRASVVTIFNSTDIGSNSFSFQNSVASSEAEILNSSIESVTRDDKLSSMSSLYR